MSSQAAQTATRWYQTKRIPLYLMVGTTVTTAAIMIKMQASHTLTEMNIETRRNPLQEVEPGGEHSNLVESLPGKGATSQGSIMRTALRESGMMDGQTTDGIFPNTAISNAMTDVLGPVHPPAKVAPVALEK